MFFFTLTFWNLQLDTEEEKKWMLLCLECIQNSLVFFFFLEKKVFSTAEFPYLVTQIFDS